MNPPAYIIALTVMVTMASCSHNVQQVPNLARERKFNPLEDKDPKRIHVFFDGTSNDWKARTNVRRRFELTATAEDPHHPCIYIEGVGVKSLAGQAFAIGMKQRVLEAYCFLARNWSQDTKDTIHVFGFSRGAFQARMLAGLMAHCGLVDAYRRPSSDKSVEKVAEEIWDYCAEYLSDPPEPGNGKQATVAVWHRKLADNRREVQGIAPCKGWQFHDPKIEFLGIWDTVPGLPFAKLRDNGEVQEGKNQPYKVRPYPNIQHIAHALSLDEKRSQFDPLIVGPPIDRASTQVLEVWFPGVHSDVGGGYLDSNDMAGTTLNWMQTIMNRYDLTKRDFSFFADAHGVIHHPENVFFNSIGSKKQARHIPAGSHIDFSLFKRTNAEPHPEDGFEQDVVYEPVLTVAQADGETVKPLKIPGKKDYTPSEARALLASVGLDLYDADTNLNNQPDGPALPISQMSVHVKEVPAAPIPPAQRP